MQEGRRPYRIQGIRIPPGEEVASDCAAMCHLGAQGAPQCQVARGIEPLADLGVYFDGSLQTSAYG